MEASRNVVARACQCRAEASNKLFPARVNGAMNGDYRDLDESFDIWEIFYFAKDDLKDCKDINLIKLYEVFNHTDQNYSSLVNLNGLGTSEKK